METEKQKTLNSKFVDSSINLDGKHYINCDFINCKIQTLTGDTLLEGCHFTKCKLELVPGSPAATSIELYKLFEKGTGLSGNQPKKRW